MFLFKLAGDLEAGKKSMDRKLCTTCGHDWHWAEIFFILSAITGTVFTVLSFIVPGIPAMVPAGLLVGSSAIATMFTWNMCTARRIGIATETLEIVVHDVARENARLRKTTEVMEDNNEEFTERIDLLEQSRVTLGRSVMSVEKIMAKQEQLVKQTEDIVEKRRGFQKQLHDLTAKENDNAAKTAMLNFEEKVLALFDMISDGPVLRCGARLRELRALLEEDGIPWTSDMTDAFASNDVTKPEFSQMMRVVLNEHMTRLNAAVLETRRLRARELILSKECSRMKEELSKRRLEEVQDSLTKVMQNGTSVEPLQRAASMTQAL